MDNGRYRSSSTWNTPRPAKKKVQAKPTKIARSGAVDFGSAVTKTRKKSTYDYDNYEEYMSEAVESASVEEPVARPVKKNKEAKEAKVSKPQKVKKTHAIAKTIFWLLLLGVFGTILVYLALETTKAIETNSLTSTQDRIISITVVSFGISLIFIYLIMSHLNRKTTKETFRSLDKFTIYILSNIILTISIAFITCVAIAQVVPKDSNSNDDTLTYHSSTMINENFTLDSGSLSSEKSDENVINISGDVEAHLSNLEVTKAGATLNLNKATKFGTNAAIIAKETAIASLSNVKVKTNAVGANGIFVLGNRSFVDVDNSEIITTDTDSAALYLAGNAAVRNSRLNAEKSMAVIIDDTRDVTLENDEISGYSNAEEGASGDTFLLRNTTNFDLKSTILNISNSRLYNSTGWLFSLISAKAEINLSSNDVFSANNNSFITLDDSQAFVKLDNQFIKGSIQADENSTLNLELINGSSMETAINTDGLLAIDITVHLDGSSTWTLAGDTYVDQLNDDIADYSNINFNGFKLYVNNEPIN